MVKIAQQKPKHNLKGCSEKDISEDDDCSLKEQSSVPKKKIKKNNKNNKIKKNGNNVKNKNKKKNGKTKKKNESGKKKKILEEDKKPVEIDNEEDEILDIDEKTVEVDNTEKNNDVNDTNDPTRSRGWSKALYPNSNTYEIQNTVIENSIDINNESSICNSEESNAQSLKIDISQDILPQDCSAYQDDKTSGITLCTTTANNFEKKKKTILINGKDNKCVELNELGNVKGIKCLPPSSPFTSKKRKLDETTIDIENNEIKEIKSKRLTKKLKKMQKQKSQDNHEGNASLKKVSNEKSKISKQIEDEHGNVLQSSTQDTCVKPHAKQELEQSSAPSNSRKENGMQNSVRKIDYKELKQLYDPIRFNIRYDDNANVPYEKKQENFRNGINGLEEYTNCLYNQLVTDISLNLLGEHNVFTPTKSIVVCAPDGYGKKKVTEQFCRHYSINLIEFFPHTMRAGMFENLLQFAYKTRVKTVIFFDNCHVWLAKEFLHQNNMFIGEFRNLLANKRHLNDILKDITFVFSTTVHPMYFAEEFNTLGSLYCFCTELTAADKLKQIKNYFNDKYRSIGLTSDVIEEECFHQLQNMCYNLMPCHINNLCDSLFQYKKSTIGIEEILQCKNKMDEWCQKNKDTLNNMSNNSDFMITDMMTFEEKQNIFSWMLLKESDIEIFKKKIHQTNLYSIDRRYYQQQEHPMNLTQEQLAWNDSLRAKDQLHQQHLQHHDNRQQHHGFMEKEQMRYENMINNRNVSDVNLEDFDEEEMLVTDLTGEDGDDTANMFEDIVEEQEIEF